ncbi:hypothetical protein LWC34_04175 [Kibdelosporangium philippinense]|uniref:DUF1353 domain-containing protein n=1 Tax=Kibdelosporangium philippinense TaxID=211113 RepID=A0ABS8Z258_9PSEU|nr:hypothetical protein [Kibdelosporangium philippinense]MCE7002029.1 hypothetical protein [Kibdelosporangium philippinense]
MTVSTFDPFRPVSDQELRDWLRHRNDLAVDQAVLDYVIPSSGMVTDGVAISMKLRAIARLVPSWRMTRAYRSGGGKIGLHECDMITILDRAQFWPTLVIRAATVALAVLISLLMAVPTWMSVLFGVMAWTTTGWRGRFAFPLLGIASALVVWFQLPLALLWAPLSLLMVLGSVSKVMGATR